MEEELHDPTNISLNIGGLDFAHGSIIGNIGAPVRVSGDEEEEDLSSPRVEEQLGEAQDVGEATELDDMAIQEVPRDIPM